MGAKLLRCPNTTAFVEQDPSGLDMNSAEQTVTWLITLGVLESPKKTISDPEAFLQSSLKDGVVLCRLLERLSPGSTEKVRAIHPPPPRVSASLCRSDPWTRRGLSSGFSFCPLVHEMISFVGHGLLSASGRAHACQ